MILSKCLSLLCSVGIASVSFQYNEPIVMTHCTPSIEPGITVTVSDFHTKLPLEAKIIVSDQNFQEELQLSAVTAAGEVVYGGVFERPGVYTISTFKDGYENSIVQNVEVTQGECHVMTRKIHIKLKPLSLES